MRNSFIFAGEPPRFTESPTVVEYSPVSEHTSFAEDDQEMSLLIVASNIFATWLVNAEYMGSTSPYDNDVS